MSGGGSIKKRSKIILVRYAGVLSLILSGALCLLLAVMQIEELNQWYETWQAQLLLLEERIIAIENRWLIVAAVMALFTLKSFFPPVTIPAICFISGMVLPWYFALLVNVTGIVWLMTIRYFWGKRFGGGRAIKFVRRNEIVRGLLEKKGTGNPYMLLLFRAIPCFPVNSISRLYGALNFNFRDYLIISVLGFMYKILSYTVIGRNVYTPLSASFLLPMIILFAVSGCLMVSIYYVIDKTNVKEGEDKNE